MEDAADRAERHAEEQQPVEEAGGGEAEGFEQAEEDLIDSATHRGREGGDADPLADRPATESDRAAANTIHGEADKPESTEEADPGVRRPAESESED